MDLTSDHTNIPFSNPGSQDEGGKITTMVNHLTRQLQQTYPGIVQHNSYDSADGVGGFNIDIPRTKGTRAYAADFKEIKRIILKELKAYDLGYIKEIIQPHFIQITIMPNNRQG